MTSTLKSIEILKPDEEKFANNLKTVVLNLQKDITGTLVWIESKKILDLSGKKYLWRNYFLGKNKVWEVLFDLRKDWLEIEYMATINWLNNDKIFWDGEMDLSRKDILLTLGFPEDMKLLIPWIWRKIIWDIINYAEWNKIRQIFINSNENSFNFYKKILDLLKKLWEIKDYTIKDYVLFEIYINV